MPNPMDAMCWVSPADEKGNIDNLSTRVARLEEIIALLTGMDISALQLSDITAKAGVLQNLAATASNAAGGWTTSGTFTGTAISTLGWKMSDGNEFPIVTMVDGVLQFGFGKNGQVAGTKPDQWDAAYQNYLTSYQQDYGNKSTIDETLRGITVGSFINTGGLTSFEMIVSRAGLYMVNTYFGKSATGKTPGQYGYVNHQIVALGTGGGTPNVEFYGVVNHLGGVEITGGLSLVISLSTDEANNSVGFYLQEGSGMSSTPADEYGMTIVRISD